MQTFHSRAMTTQHENHQSIQAKEQNQQENQHHQTKQFNQQQQEEKQAKQAQLHNQNQTSKDQTEFPVNPCSANMNTNIINVIASSSNYSNSSRKKSASRSALKRVICDGQTGELLMKQCIKCNHWFEPVKYSLKSDGFMKSNSKCKNCER
jgi:DNA polymerase III alpha subunit (gram-positive type)